MCNMLNDIKITKRVLMDQYTDLSEYEWFTEEEIFLWPEIYDIIKVAGVTIVCYY